MPTVTSGNITLIDLTDTKKVDIHISSNLPTIQIYNPNDSQNPFTPNWEDTPLVLEAKVYADSTPVTNEIGNNFTWTRKIGDKLEPLSEKTNTLTISTNELSQSTVMVQYICSITYNKNPYENMITFARTDVGRDGASGNNAPAVKAQYSEDGISGWTDVLDENKHKYIHLSYDNGATWPSIFKIAGKDGNSVAIKGTATSVAIVNDTNYYTVTYNGNLIETAELGDSYLYNGDLYVCSEQKDGLDYFINVGKIQGPQGQKGDSYYLFIRYADNASGSGISTTPDGKSYIGFYRSSVNQVPTDVSSATWNWAKFVGEDAKNITLTGNAQAFKVNKNNIISPAEIKVTAQVENTSITSWSYNIDGSTTFTTTRPAGVSAPSGNTITINGSMMTSSLITIKASDGVHSDIFTVYKVSDGSDGEQGEKGESAPIVFLTNENISFAANEYGQVIKKTTVICDVVAYSGTTPIVPTIGAISSSDIPSGMTINKSDESRLTITVDENATLGSTQSTNGEITIPVTSPISANLKLTWSKINSGVKGDTGATGRGVSKVTEYYLATTESANITTNTSGWTTTIQSIDVTKKYLWNYEVITYTDETTSMTNPIIIGVYGSTGETGKGIKSITEYYLATASSSGVTTLTTGWTPEIQTLTATKRYLWNYEIITYTDGTTSTINPVIIGVYGDKGDKGLDGITFQVYSVTGYIISNETPILTLQTFAYDGSTEITSGATYQWSQYIDDVWTNISEATTKTLVVTKGDVLKAKSYKCTMTYKSKQYVATVTVQDKTDIYNSIMCVSSNATDNNCYWVLYTLVYSDTEEVDPLLGPISINAPTSPVNGDYWYAVDSINATVTLKKYNGTSWENSADKQSLSYYWDMINDGSAQIPLGDSAKVKVISCHDFTSTATLVCEVSNLEDGLLTQSSLSLTDASDPIVSDTEPTATVSGQIWIKPNDNGTYLMFIWDESVPGWISSDMDTRSKVYTSRPSSYNAGDLWITASDTDHGSYLHGTLLQAQAYNTTYNAADWSPTLRYDQDLDDMKETLNNLSQYVTITSSGLRVAARDDAGNLSEFTSLFTSEALTFYQGSKELLILANNQLTAPKIVVEDELEVQGEIKLGDLKLIIESNGSFSFAVQK